MALQESPRLDRRAFLRAVGSSAAATAASLVLDACGASKPPTSAPIPTFPISSPTLLRPTAIPTTPPEILPTVVEANIELVGRDRLLSEIDSLPDTYIKQLLQERVEPYFADASAYPLTLERDDGRFKFRVYGAQVAEEKIDTLGTAGRLNPRSGIPTTRFRPSEETKIQVPLIFNPSEAEALKMQIPSKFKLSDGSGYFAEITYSPDPDKGIYDGLKPAVLIRTPKEELIPQNEREYFQQVKRFVAVKEACSLLLYDLVMEETYKKMKKHGFKTHMNVVDSNNKAEEIEMVNKALSDMGAIGGRFLAILDTGGYYLAMKAFENDPKMLSYLKRDWSFRPVLSTLSNYKFGNTPQEVIKATENWALHEPSAGPLHHLGDIDRFPMNIKPSDQYEFALERHIGTFIYTV